MSYIKPVVEWVDGAGLVFYYVVIDKHGNQLARFSERDDAETYQRGCVR